jgi:hypothetical protein
MAQAMILFVSGSTFALKSSIRCKTAARFEPSSEPQNPGRLAVFAMFLKPHLEQIATFKYPNLLKEAILSLFDRLIFRFF